MDKKVNYNGRTYELGFSEAEQKFQKLVIQAVNESGISSDEFLHVCDYFSAAKAHQKKSPQRDNSIETLLKGTDL